MTVSGGGGSGAAAHANISGGVVISISVDSTGNGAYTSGGAIGDSGTTIPSASATAGRWRKLANSIN